MSESGRLQVTGIDQQARDMAQQAISSINAHERVCAERAKEAATWRASTTDKLDAMSTTFAERLTNVDHAVTDRMANMGKAVTVLSNRMWTAMVGLVVTLLGVAGYLIAHHGL